YTKIVGGHGFVVCFLVRERVCSNQWCPEIDGAVAVRPARAVLGWRLRRSAIFAPSGGLGYRDRRLVLLSGHDVVVRVLVSGLWRRSTGWAAMVGSSASASWRNVIRSGSG